MNRINQKGAIHFILLIILVIGLGAGIWLVTSGNPLNILPKASISGPVGPTTSFTLSPNSSSVGVGSSVGVKIVVRSDVAAANLFTAKLKFNKELLAVERIDYSNSLINNWVEQFSDNATGEISLVGGVPAPGFQTSGSEPPPLMATIYFVALKPGNADISFTGESAIYDNSNNLNILSQKTDATVAVILSGGSTPTPVPTSTPDPITGCTPCSADLDGNKIVSGLDYSISVTCAQRGVNSQDNAGRKCKVADINNDGKISDADVQCVRVQFGKTCVEAFNTPLAISIPGVGDGNNDGKINLMDISVMMSDWQKTKGFRPGIDLDDNKVINTLDYSLMLNLLRSKGVIRG